VYTGCLGRGLDFKQVDARSDDNGQVDRLRFLASAFASQEAFQGAHDSAMFNGTLAAGMSIRGGVAFMLGVIASQL
jgi:hypothetical protein